MSFVKLTEVEALEEIPEGVNIFAEVEGAIKRIPGEGLGGSDIRTAIIKQDGYDNALAGVAAAESAVYTYTCENMTFDEAVQIIMSGGYFEAVVHSFNIDGGSFSITHISQISYESINFAVPCICLLDSEDGITYWTADGISNTTPELASA